ncbi:Uncharacterised protein [Mycobacteroides abscessus subsp. abscessus]|nr:Uncharacterised protein [Mycobacteroides abscessus subsp. abscessus]
MNTASGLSAITFAITRCTQSWHCGYGTPRCLGTSSVDSGHPIFR